MAFNCENPCIVCSPAPPGTRGLSPNDPNNPFLNLSSEGPDFDGYIGRNNYPNPPLLGTTFYRVGCLGFCVSDISQADADLCAARQAIICASVNNPVSNPNPVYNPGNPGSTPPTTDKPRPLFSNTPQSCQATCADGSVNTYTVPAGTIFGFNQATANAEAYSLACLKANQEILCLGEISASRICFGQSGSATVSVSRAFLTATFAVVNGSLPPGMTLSDDGVSIATISGTPTAGGTFTFTLGCTDAAGDYGERTYELMVFGITDYSVLASGTVGTAYSKTLTVGGTTVGSSSFSVVKGSLPPGLTLNAGVGVISGTPTAYGDYAFTVRLQDDSIACDRDFTIHIDHGAGVFAGMVWGAPTILLAGASSAGTANGAGNSGHLVSSVGAYVFGPANTSTIGITGTVNLNPILGIPITGLIQGTVFGSKVGIGTCVALIQVLVDAALVYQRGTFAGSVGDGTFSAAWTGVPRVITVQLSGYNASGAGAPVDAEARNSSCDITILQT